VIAADGAYPQIGDVTASFVYARIMGTVESETMGYSPAGLDLWASRAKAWSKGDVPTGIDTLAAPLPAMDRDVFIYVISGFKKNNPIAATALIERIGGSESRNEAASKERRSGRR
jgi:uncharacterized protein YecE (DUF72 family)